MDAASDVVLLVVDDRAADGLQGQTWPAWEQGVPCDVLVVAASRPEPGMVAAHVEATDGLLVVVGVDPSDPDVRHAALLAGASDVVPADASLDEVLLRVERQTDVVALRRTAARNEVERRAADAQLQQFTYTASHDLKEPLRAITGFSRLLNDRYADVLDDNASTYLRFIMDGGERLASMINALLEYSRMQRRDVEPIDLDLQEVVEAQVRSPHDDPAWQQVEIGALPRVRTDETLVTTMLGHLIDNAVKFAAPDRPNRVRVEGARVDAETVEVCVSDTGIGIAESDQTRVFDVFTRLHTREQYPGHGVGLGLVTLLVSRLEGTVSLASVQGEGTTITVTLPDLDPRSPSSVSRR